MCYSANASLMALATGLFFSGWMATWKNPSYQVIGLFIAFVSLMQGVEYLLWNHPICDEYHKGISIVGMFLNHSQPIVLAVLLLFFNPSTPNRSLILGLTLLYTIFVIPYSAQFVTDESLQTSISHMFIEYAKNVRKMRLLYDKITEVLERKILVL